MTTHTTELPTRSSIRPDSFLRLSSILSPIGPLPISRSSWWLKVRRGEFPQPIKLGPRTTAWRGKDIIDLIERLENGGNQ
ncbi:helix-turn-helix transcriptional regulator [Rhizobium laguerreae]|uniref:helix-turn-helix transcriptional regulator n=1 Tax=Rhizobium laguerreae TaxID=1076926 RepID=UPI001C9130D0|nr:AlpA family phage regulatory protein [Rhizobium laguerreae]MBY3565717.1 AlpA family phage regulatory protein [Rhizobium laguerreae]